MPVCGKRREDRSVKRSNRKKKGGTTKRRQDCMSEGGSDQGDLEAQPRMLRVRAPWSKGKPFCLQPRLKRGGHEGKEAGSQVEAALCA